jgi:hypothetical protein
MMGIKKWEVFGAEACWVAGFGIMKYSFSWIWAFWFEDSWGTCDNWLGFSFFVRTFPLKQITEWAFRLTYVRWIFQTHFRQSFLCYCNGCSFFFHFSNYSTFHFRLCVNPLNLRTYFGESILPFYYQERNSYWFWLICRTSS